MVNFNGGSGTGHTNSAASGAIGRGGSSYFGGTDGSNRQHSGHSVGGSGGADGGGAPGSGGPGSRTDTGWSGASGKKGAVIVYEYE